MSTSKAGINSQSVNRLDALEATSGASMIGADDSGGLTPASVQAQLNELKSLIDALPTDTVVVYSGMVNTSGAIPTHGSLPAGWSATPGSTGKVTITHNLGIPVTSYHVVSSRYGQVTTVAGQAAVGVKTTNSFELIHASSTGTVQNGDVAFIMNVVV